MARKASASRKADSSGGDEGDLLEGVGTEGIRSSSESGS